MTKVVILAGGLGTRLSEYTKEIPKPMIKIKGIPILKRIMNHYSKFGFKGKNEKLFVAAELQTQTLLLNTYEGNVLRNRSGEKGLIAKFLSPLTASFSPGIDFKPNSNLSLFYSPISYKLIYVNDPSVAALNIHGNLEGEQSLRQMGSNLKIVYSP